MTTMHETPSVRPFSSESSNGKSRGCCVLAVTSGKGGVGKTFVSANLAASLSSQGQRVLVIDADLGLANLDVVLNLHPKTTLHDVFAGKVKLQEAIVKAPGGFSVLLAGSGMIEYSRLTAQVKEQLFEVVKILSPSFDVIILDTGAGIADLVLFGISMADEVLVVATPEPTSLTDAYATIKVLSMQQKRQRIRIIVNQTIRHGDGRAITGQLQQVLDRFVLSETGAATRLVHLGDIPEDSAVRAAIMRRQLLITTTPSSNAALAIGQLARKITETILC